MKRAISIFGIIVVLIFIGWLKLNGKDKSEVAAQSPPQEKKEEVVPVRVATAEGQTMAHTIAVTGTITAQREVSVAAEITGKVVFVGAEEGDRVTAGQVLVRLDDREARSQVARAEAALAQARSRVAGAEASRQLTMEQVDSDVNAAEVALQAARSRARELEHALKLTEEQVAHQIAQAEKELEAAQENLRLIQAGARPQEIAQAQAAVDAAAADIRQSEANVLQAEADEEQARIEYERVQGLFSKGFASQQQVDTARTRLTNAKARVAANKARLETVKTQLKQAQERLSLLREGARPEEIAIAQARVAAAAAALNEARARRKQVDVRQQELESAKIDVRQREEALHAAKLNRGKAQISQQEIAALRSSVRQAQAELELARQTLRHCTLTAPLSGLISQRLVEPGEVIAPGAPLLTIVSSEVVFFAAEVPERDIPNVHLGQPVEVEVDALPHETRRGTVVEILPSTDLASRRFIANVALPNRDGKLREGMFARGRILVARAVRVVLVPLDAVVRREGKEFIAVVKPNNEVTIRPVKLGASQGEKVVVLEGISAGETVVTAGAPQLKEKAKVEVVK
ncbi:MAG: efflux RND transporter periplasmic adaptor subunit [Abditibacteriales bacterium]|nr:efflux RND transporter periplasmic adaptor subunit [Abditibacteriales bacterium]MDW8368334.1 efflux RND transporter periplasmic adaptor subunit [Abditibacteriales bacterium]